MKVCGIFFQQNTGGYRDFGDGAGGGEEVEESGE